MTSAENKTAQEKVIKGETKSGFSFAIPAHNLDNMELIDAIAGLTQSDPLQMSNVILLLLGKEQRKSLYDHVRLEDGTVPTQEVSDEMTEIFTLSNTAIKN